MSNLDSHCWVFARPFTSPWQHWANKPWLIPKSHQEPLNSKFLTSGAWSYWSLVPFNMSRARIGTCSPPCIGGGGGPSFPLFADNQSHGQSSHTAFVRLSAKSSSHPKTLTLCFLLSSYLFNLWGEWSGKGLFCSIVDEVWMADHNFECVLIYQVENIHVHCCHTDLVYNFCSSFWEQQNIFHLLHDQKGQSYLHFSHISQRCLQIMLHCSTHHFHQCFYSTHCWQLRINLLS